MTLMPVLFMLTFGAFALFAGVFWIWMLIECAMKEPSEGNDKIVWIIIILFMNWLGALIYLIARRPKRVAEHGR